MTLKYQAIRIGHYDNESIIIVMYRIYMYATRQSSGIQHKLSLSVTSGTLLIVDTNRPVTSYATILCRTEQLPPKPVVTTY